MDETRQEPRGDRLGHSEAARPARRPSRMNPFFWAVVALDLALFLGLLISMLVQRGGSESGGREMGIAFFVIAPLLLIGAAVLLYVFTRSPVWKIIALIIVAGPGLFIAGGRI